MPLLCLTPPPVLRPQDLARAVLHNQVNVVIHLPHLTLSQQQEGEDISRRSRRGSRRRRRRGRYDAAAVNATTSPSPCDKATQSPHGYV